MIRPLLFCALLTGCTPEIKPTLNLPQQVQSCPKLELKPVPQKVLLDIQGDKVIYDDGGGQLLRGYVACRAVYR